MKKLVAFVLVAAMALSLVAFVGCGEKWSYDDDYHWHTEEDKALHTAENGVCAVCGTTVTHTVGLEYELVTPETRKARNTAYAAEPEYQQNGSYYVVTGIGDSAADEIDLVIPATHNGIPVKEIGDNAFYYYGSGWNKPYVKSVVLAEGLEKIGQHAFALTDITSLSIPSTVTFIGESAFYLTDIVSVVIPKTVTLSHYSFGSPTVIYSEWTSEERKDIDKTNAYYEQCAVFYYREDFTTTPAGEHSWHYNENGDIVEYTNWQGFSDREYLTFNNLVGSSYWQTAADQIVFTATANGDVEMVIEHRWWDSPDSSSEHIDSTSVVFDTNDEFNYTIDVYYFVVPDGYTGNEYPGTGWDSYHYTATLTILRPEIQFKNGKICMEIHILFGTAHAENGDIVPEITPSTATFYIYLG